MPFTDVIDDYSNGASGTLTDVNGAQVGYTVTGTSPNTNWQGLTGGARVNANGTQSFTVTFDAPVVGASMQISGSDSNEIYYIEVDGVTVNLQTLIDNGDATFTQSGAATHQIGADGSIAGGHYSDGSIAELVFHIPVTSLGAYGTNGNSGNWDYFEVGIDATAFDVVCFAGGTRLETPQGLRAVEEIAVGDLLVTADQAPQRVVWIGSRRVSEVEMAAVRKLRPVRISAGALGDGVPQRDLLVSRQHRMVVSSKIANRMFGTASVMVPAIKLVEMPGIFEDAACTSVEYFHVLLDNHAVIFAEGAPTESLLCGDMALRTLSQAARAEIAQIFPNQGPTASAMPIPSRNAQSTLIRRHCKNGQALVGAHVAH